MFVVPRCLRGYFFTAITLPDTYQCIHISTGIGPVRRSTAESTRQGLEAAFKSAKPGWLTKNSQRVAKGNSKLLFP
jgi:hypothetical protein